MSVIESIIDDTNLSNLDAGITSMCSCTYMKLFYIYENPSLAADPHAKIFQNNSNA